MSARPGFSEHQSGLAADVVPCAGECGSLDALAGSPQGAWLAEHGATSEAGTAHWIATYTFAQTGRRVVNDIRAEFRFADGLFAEHVDRFSFWRWSRQALGAPGLLLGWTPLLRGKVSAQARRGLEEYRAGR